MQVILNGEERTLQNARNLAEALEEWGYRKDTPIAVAVNNVVVPKQNHASTLLTANNIIEILMPMQGG
ncbi:MAG: sulfur carrier protein ThiS [Gammaproteobacteria bacterium]